MAENKILPWAQTGTANVLSDSDYASDVASGGLYGDGVKTGQASSKQANKTWRQATAPGSGLGQFLVDNLGVDVTDADTPATFSTRIANAVLKLAQISPFNQSWATATGGYRKYAIVSDSSGNFWVSTADANTTVPGSAGAKWKSLFYGYATQSWANGQFLQLATTATQTVTGPVAFASSVGNFVFQSDGNCVFYDKNGNSMFSVGSSRMLLNSNMEAHFNGLTYSPSVTDWTTKQVVPASDADARYAHDGAAFTIGNTTGSGVSNTIKYGTQSRIQLQGDDNAVFYDNLGPFCSFRRDGSIFRSPITVPDVTDFTSENALNAKTADKRYVRNNAGTQGGIVALDLDGDGSGRVTFEKADGSWGTLQLAGDYATNTALDAEITRAKGAENNLQSSKVNRAGDTGITGPLGGAFNSDTAYAVYGSWLDTTGIRYGAGYWTGISADSRGGIRYYYNAGVISYTTLVHKDGDGYAELRLDTSGRFHNDKGDTAAWVSELPTAGTLSGGTYTKTPMNDGTGRSVLRQCFVLQVNDYATVTFPISYPNAPVLNVYTSDESSGKSVVSNYRWGTLTGSSFQIHNSWILGSAQGNQDGLFIHVVVEGVV